MTAIDRVLLIGMMGAGKTTVGHALRDRLGWPYYDNDDLVAEATGASKETLLDRVGVASLRNAETAALLLALHRDGPLIAGIAGGVVLDAHNTTLLANRGDGALVIWLAASLEVLAARIEADPQDRPWLEGDTLAALRRLAAEREPEYGRAADLVIRVDEVPLVAVVDRIATLVAASVSGITPPPA